MDRTTVIAVIGCIITVASLWLVWATTSFGGDFTMWGLRERYFYDMDSFVAVIATSAPFGIMIFTLITVVEGIINAKRPAYYGGHYGLWTIANGVFMVFFTVCIFLTVRDIEPLVRGTIIPYIAVIGSAMVLVAGILGMKDERRVNNE